MCNYGKFIFVTLSYTAVFMCVCVGGVYRPLLPTGLVIWPKYSKMRWVIPRISELGKCIDEISNNVI